MVGRRLPAILFLCLAVLPAIARDRTADTHPLHPYSDTAVYQGTFVKLDAFTPVYTAIRSRGALQSYEAAVNVRLINKLYPVIEGGYAYGRVSRDSVTQAVNGGFMRAGLDYNPLRRSIRSPHALLIGLRAGCSLQEQCDAWGELAAGCQVKIAGGFYMGWTFRLKMLFTRKNATAAEAAVYIPGYGERDDISWGLNYCLAWRF